MARTRRTEDFRLRFLRVACGPPDAATATVYLIDRRGAEQVGSAVGLGSVDAIYGAIQRIVGVPIKLLDYHVQQSSVGGSALGEVSVHIALRNGSDCSYRGYGTDADVIVASAKAYLAATNSMLAADSTLAAEAVKPMLPTAAVTAASAPATSAFAEEPFDPDYTAGIP